METVKFGSKEWNNIADTIFNKNDKICREANYYDDCWNFFVAEDLIEKILNDKLSIDKECIEFVFEKCSETTIFRFFVFQSRVWYSLVSRNYFCNVSLSRLHHCYK